MKTIEELTEEDALKVLNLKFPDEEITYVMEVRIIPKRQISWSGANVGIVHRIDTDANLDTYLVPFDEVEKELNEVGYTIGGYYD